MYSVEDLLISHGYKLSRNPPAPHGDRYDGYQQESSESRAGHGTLNGYEAHPTAFAYNKKSLGKGYLSDNEHSGAVSGSHRDPPNSSAFHHSKEGFYNQPPLEWSSQPKPDLAYWRRKGQDFSVLLDYTDRGNLETPRMAEPHGMNRNVREGQLEVGSRLENMMKRAVLEDSWKISRDPKWQNANFESWNQPRRLGRQMSDGDGEKLLQDVYSFTKGDNTFNSQNKGKSQSLPRVLSPDSLRCVEMPILINDYHFPGDAKMLFYPTNSTSNLEYLRNPEKGDPYTPLQKPKYGRPLKPPSYELHRQTRSGVETSRYQDNYQKDCVSFLPQTNEPRQDPYNPDPNLEPPMYVPPPSYRSPPQQNTNPHFLNEVPHFQYGGHIQQQQRLMMEKPVAGHYSSSSSYRSGNQYGASGCPPHGLSGPPQHVEACNSSVQYIPFNDPRIRHIKMTHHQDLGQQTKFLETLYTTGPSDFQGPARVQAQDDGAFLHPESQVPTAKSENDPATYAPSLGWLPAATPPDREICALPDQRDNCVLSEQQPDKGSSRQQCTKGRVSSQNPQWESTCETITKLKTFQTGIQTKKSSKKKVNETVFCLVSVPVKSEPHLPDTDRNNNDLKQNADKKNGNDKNGALQEQSLLSMSSTDLELQALTGNMASKTELQKQGPGGPKQYKQTNDLRFSHPIKHRELRYSGSWPGDQYRDQQTQTPITQESQTSQFLSAKKMESQHDALPLPKVSDPTLKLLEPSASETLKTTASPPSDWKMRPNTCNLKGQMYFSPSSNSAFSRTASSTIPTSKAGQNQPHGPSANINERDTKPVVKGQVVKGESSAPCNSKELFGQFLLKPVSRRPWDVISQLESFNKELQEQEESSSNCSRSSSSIDGEVAESEQQMQEDIGADTDLKDYKPHEPSQDMRVGLQPRITAPEIPVFKSGRVKSVELISDFICDYPQAQIPLQRRDSKGESVKPLVESMIPETRKQEIEYRIDRLAISPDPGKRMMSSSLMKTAPNPTGYPTDIREPQESRQYSDVLNSIQPSQMIHPRSEGVKERESEGHISLVNKTQGLSESEVKFVEHDMGPVQRANKLDGILEKPGAIEIPPNEPLQTRAARILGIEVAVESLIHGNKDKGPNLPPGPAENIPKADFPAVERSYNLVQPNPPEPTSSKSAFDSRRKCGCTESPLFVGDRDTHLKTRVIHQDSEVNPDGNGDDTSNSLIPELEPKSSSKLHDQKDLRTNQSYKSTLFHYLERNSTGMGSEKKFRSTSKVIETIQEKLVSPPTKTAVDRLMRMKEVNSISRIRRLSSKSTDSGEETEEEKIQRRLEGQKRSFGSLNGSDPGHKVEDADAVSKHIISLEENGHHTVPSVKKNAEQDFFCLDTYDPSRVERV